MRYESNENIEDLENRFCGACCPLPRLLQQQRRRLDVNNLAGTWERVYNEGVMDAGTEQYTFYPESSTAGRIELYVNAWPDFKEEITDLNYVVGHTGHMNIFTGKKHDGKSRVYGEYDIHKLSSSEMIWYRTDSKEELARFKKVR